MLQKHMDKIAANLSEKNIVDLDFPLKKNIKI